MMQIAPIRQAARTSSTSRPRLAPLGGWNTADPLTATANGAAATAMTSWNTYTETVGLETKAPMTFTHTIQFGTASALFDAPIYTSTIEAK